MATSCESFEAHERFPQQFFIESHDRAPAIAAHHPKG
jgi:hypothetical protein